VQKDKAGNRLPKRFGLGFLKLLKKIVQDGSGDDAEKCKPGTVRIAFEGVDDSRGGGG